MILDFVILHVVKMVTFYPSEMYRFPADWETSIQARRHDFLADSFSLPVAPDFCSIKSFTIGEKQNKTINSQITKRREENLLLLGWV